MPTPSKKRAFLPCGCIGGANRLAELVEGIRSIQVKRDDTRELLTLVVTDRSGTEHEARALSDGTLRFLALAVLEVDPKAAGLLCLEEPENGIHPERLGAMMNLLQELAVDPQEPISEGNPLRQVIINTHSPSVVNIVPDDTLLYAGLEPLPNGHKAQGAMLRWLPSTWRSRANPKVRTMAKGGLIAYLNPTGGLERDPAVRVGKPHAPVPVGMREDLQMLLPYSPGN